MSKEIVKASTSSLALPDDIAEEFAQYVEQDQQYASVQGGFAALSTRNGVFTFEGETFPEDTIEVVVLGAMARNLYYTGTFDPDKIAAPDCYAIDFNGDSKTMGPPPDLKDRVSVTCHDCDLNQWGSGKGKGKACKNTMRLAVLPVAGGSYLKEAGASLSIPVTSTKAWGTYAKKVLGVLKRPLFSVTTRVTISPDPRNQFSLSFELGDMIDEVEVLRGLSERRNTDGQASLEQLPDMGRDEEEEKGAKRPARTAGKTRKAVVRAPKSGAKKRAAKRSARK